MIVVDASVVVDLVLGPGSPAGDFLAASLLSGTVACAPHLIDAEIGQVVRRYELGGEIDEPQATAALADAMELPIVRYPHTRLVDRAFQLRRNMTMYDGLYLALAEVLEVPFVTGDSALAAVPGCNARVEFVATSK
ncbi:MAG: type II toxin-antitoxin system VapC family toxin [Acidimicrobiia bacterium]